MDLTPGTSTRASEDWDAFRAVRGCVTKYNILLEGRTISWANSINRHGKGDRWIRMHNGFTANVYSVKCS
jgi:hypothetical protein